MRFLGFLIISAVVNLFWALLAWIGLAAIVEPDVRYWDIYIALYFLFTIPMAVIFRASRVSRRRSW